MPKRKSRGSRKPSTQRAGKPSSKGRRTKSGPPRDRLGRFAAKRSAAASGSRKLSRASSRKTASDALTTKDWRRLLKHDPEKLRFRKKGKRKIVVLDTKGRSVAELPFRPGMAREVKARLRLAGGKPKVRDIKKLKLFEGKGWRLLRHIPTHGDMTIWERRIFTSRQGVPLGQPRGAVIKDFRGDDYRARSGKELWPVFARIRTVRWPEVLARIPQWFRERQGAVGVAITVLDPDGEPVTYRTGTGWTIEGLTDPYRGWRFLEEMFMAGLQGAARRAQGANSFKGGRCLLISIDLILAVREPGAPLPAVYGRPLEGYGSASSPQGGSASSPQAGRQVT